MASFNYTTINNEIERWGKLRNLLDRELQLRCSPDPADGLKGSLHSGIKCNPLKKYSNGSNQEKYKDSLISSHDHLIASH